MPGQPDYTVALVGRDGDPDMTVAVIGDQVVSLVGSSPGDVLTVQAGGDTVAPEPLSPTIHTVGTVGEPAFANSWVNYGAPFIVAAFYKDALGVVHLEGLIKSGSTGTAAFTLPAGFRPGGNLLHPIDAGSVFGQVEVDADGSVIVTGSNAYLSLSGVSFRAV